MNIRQGNIYEIEMEDSKPTRVILTLVEKGKLPNRQAKLALFAFTNFGLHRLTDPVLVQDTENIQSSELKEMLGAYKDYPQKQIAHLRFNYWA